MGKVADDIFDRYLFTLFINLVVKEKLVTFGSIKNDRL